MMEIRSIPKNISHFEKSPGHLKKRIAIIGSTGSIGKQALDVIRRNPERFSVEVLTAHSNHSLLVEQAIEFIPNAVVIGNEACYREVADALSGYPVKVFTGEASVSQVTEMDTVDLVLNALVGYSGLKPTLTAINAGKDIALANKESLVVAGDLVMKKAREKGVMIIPVDSEHSAIFQCLVGESHNEIEKIILTASGGPFLGKKLNDLRDVTVEQALKHPNWNMGSKITIDSATLMNKGLEIIEAKWLFNMDIKQIDVIIHPQSIIHSMVEFVDGSIKAQMGLPDMKLPIQYALGYPERLESNFKKTCLPDIKTLTFYSPDLEKFECLRLAYQVMDAGGTSPCVLNAANEIAVDRFLKGEIKFSYIPNLINKTLDKIENHKSPDVDTIFECDKLARDLAVQL